MRRLNMRMSITAMIVPGHIITNHDDKIWRSSNGSGDLETNQHRQQHSKAGPGKPLVFSSVANHDPKSPVRLNLPSSAIAGESAPGPFAQ
jgi:hypothetical protein